MKKIFLLLWLTVFCCGCMHVEEHLTIDQNGSAELKTHLKVHAGTVQLLDAMLGGMMQAFSSMAGKDGQSVVAPKESVAEKMFANREDLQGKIRKSGVDASLESFSARKDADGLWVDYAIRVRDVTALSGTKLLMTKVRIVRNVQGDWFCRPLVDRKKREEGRSQQRQFDSFRGSEQFKSMPQEVRKQVQDSIMDFRMEFTVVFPVKVTEAKGLFVKKDDCSAGFVFSMDLLQDPERYSQLFSSAGKQMVRTGVGPVPDGFFMLDPSEADVSPEDQSSGSKHIGAGGDDAAAQSSYPAQTVFLGQRVKLQLKSGMHVEGQVLEKNSIFVRIDFEGVPLTYYNEEIESVK